MDEISRHQTANVLMAAVFAKVPLRSIMLPVSPTYNSCAGLQPALGRPDLGIGSNLLTIEG